MASARRAWMQVMYRERDISNLVISCEYKDNYDKTDGINIQLADVDMRWLKDWFPETGDKIEATIQLRDWITVGDNRWLPLGLFEIGSVKYSDTITIDATVVPFTSSARSEKKNRSWKKISLQSIARDIAANAGIRLFYDTSVDPFYDVADQNDKSDIEFLEMLCKSDGLCLKATNRKLIVFEEAKYETKKPITRIIRGHSEIIGHPTFRRNARDVYSSCTVSHFDPKTDQLYTGHFQAPEVGNVGHNLIIREQFNSESDDMNLDRKARARLREQNKNEWICDIKMLGDVLYQTGQNIEIEGWHRFDGIYHIVSCTHNLRDSGYSTSMRTRRCLEGY